MSDIIRTNLQSIPDDVELIVGIPRSGMLPATLLAVYLNLPLTDTMSLLHGKHAASSRNYRVSGDKNSTDIRDYKKILVIDDSCNTGLSINEVKTAISNIPDCTTEVLYACVYAAPAAIEFVDLFFEIVPQPRVFEWNIMNHALVQASFFDMDGVLCVDPNEEQNDDGEKYIDFILNAKPLWIPKFSIGAIVTSRLEKYRTYTEEWLKKAGVKYQNLVMLNLESKEERIRLGAHGPFKASIYGNNPAAVLFVESDPKQASFIAQATGKAVYCCTTADFYDEDASLDTYLDVKEKMTKYGQEMKAIISKLESITNDLLYKGALDIDIVESIKKQYASILSSFRNNYDKADVGELSDALESLQEYMEQNDADACENLLQMLPLVSRKVIDTGNHKILTMFSSKVTNNAWNRS